ncbi:MAG TPA: hypothetical protein PL143_01450 [Rhodocyclaceae bacterium]|nr:hypothetical protein [Rhodocyclaceae bacterium]
MDKPVYEVPEFCADHGISKVHLYALWKEGRGPRRMKVGRRVFVTREAAAEWRERMERETEQSGVPQ